MASYLFEITLNSTKVRCVIDANTVKERNFEEDIQRQPHLETISVLEQWLKRWEWIAKASDPGQSLLVPDTFRVLGDNLWNLALANKIGRELIQAHQKMAGEDEDSSEPIRLRISFEQDASDLAALPWEYVRRPDGPDEGFFLASHTNLVLGRYLEDFRDLDIRTSDLKVRVLFVELLPQEHEHERKFWEQHDEFRGMIDRLSTIGGAFEIEKIYGWNPAEVARRLDDFKTKGKIVDVVHLVAVCEEGYGGPLLYLPEDGGPLRWSGQDPQPVVKALTDDPSTRPELVVLHLSDRRGENPPAHFERLAPSFIKAGIPAVLAMQYPMTPPHGQDFVYTFYLKLTEGKAIGEAVQAARRDLYFGRQPNRHWGAPVLYMQSKVDSRLLRIPTAAETLYNVKPDAPSMHSELGLRHLAADRPASIAQILLTDAQANSPNPATAEALQDWINSVTWPNDLNKVWLILQAGLRAKLDDSAQVEIYGRWMGMVSDMLKKQSEQ